MSGTKPHPAAKKAIIAISSHVVRGAVGNRSSVFAMERLGIPVWSVPTVILAYHPGHGRSTRIEPEQNEFENLLADLLSSPWTGEVAGILTGYMASAHQAQAVAEFVASLKGRDPRLIYLCDPVIGDSAGLYVAGETAAAMRDSLIPQSDIAAPNLHELAFLTGGTAAANPEKTAQLARKLGRPVSVVTSAPAFGRGNIGNLLVDNQKAFVVEHEKVDGPSNGSGDLLSSLLLAHWINGVQPEDALRFAASSVFEIYAQAATAGSSEIMPQIGSKSLVQPTAKVELRHLGSMPESSITGEEFEP